VDRLASQIWYLEDGRLRVFKGSYQAYLDDRDWQWEKAREAVADERAAKKATRQVSTNGSHEKRRAERIKEIEQEIARLETTLDELSKQLQRAGEKEAFDKMQSLGLEYATVEEQLETLLHEWENLAREQTLA
jgi:ATP-binding cassette subfamily F protein 3